MDRGKGKGKGKGKGCELCPGTARMYCESDEAMLCWECDARVHGANFLVARHTRALLCRTCQSPTPWRASGSRLGPSVSLCHRCSPHSHSHSPADDLRRGGGEAGGRSESEAEEEHDDDEGDGGGEHSEDSADEEEEEEEGDNQVVPWSPPPPPPPPPTTSSSSSEEEEEAEEEEESSRAEIGAGSGGGSGSSLKRMRDNADLASHPQDDLPSSSLQLSRFQSAQPPLSGRASTTDDDDEEATSVGGSGSNSNSAGFRLLKDRRRLLGHLVSRSDPAEPTGSTRRSQPTTAGEPCGPSRAAISTIDFVQAT